MDRKVYSAAVTGALAVFILITLLVIAVAVAQHPNDRNNHATDTALSAARAAKEKVVDEIEATPAGDLVGTSPRAQELECAREALVDEFSRRSVDRLREILRRDDGTGSP